MAALHPDARDRFMGWQCLLRQHVVRKLEGRPSPGMQPEIEVEGYAPHAVTVLIIKQDPADITAEFRHLVKRTHDPQGRYDSAIRLLSEYYYQRPGEFDEEMTALFPLDSEYADHLVGSGQCVLRFEQANRQWTLPCRTRELEPGDRKYEATYWHNHLFNDKMPGRVKIIGFRPDWQQAIES